MRYISCSTLCLIYAGLANAADDKNGWQQLLYGFFDLATNLAALALLIFLVIVWRFGGFKAVTQSLDDRATRIEDELEQARSLREAATDSFAKAQRRQEEASNEADALIKNAQLQADAMIDLARKTADESLARKEAQLEARIARAEAEAIQNVKNRAVELASEASALLLKDVSDQGQIQATLADLEK